MKRTLIITNRLQESHNLSSVHEGQLVIEISDSAAPGAPVPENLLGRAPIRSSHLQLKGLHTACRIPNHASCNIQARSTEQVSFYQGCTLFSTSKFPNFSLIFPDILQFCHTLFMDPKVNFTLLFTIAYNVTCN